MKGASWFCRDVSRPVDTLIALGGFYSPVTRINTKVKFVSYDLKHSCFLCEVFNHLCMKLIKICKFLGFNFRTRILFVIMKIRCKLANFCYGELKMNAKKGNWICITSVFSNTALPPNIHELINGKYQVSEYLSFMEGHCYFMVQKSLWLAQPSSVKNVLPHH